MEFEKLTIAEYIDGIKNKSFTATSAVKYFEDRIKKDHRNCVLEFFQSAYEQAKRIDQKVKKGEVGGRLLGVPVIIKDNILYKGHKATAGSKILADFVAPYSATIVERLIGEDAIIIGRANMDEFGFGTTGANSCYGITKNALSDDHYSGGSSSGSAVCVAGGLCLVAIGTDTGGSVRTPSAWNGLYGIKPTYGKVSRHGVVAFASSLDQAGPIAKTADDVEIVLDVISGHDKKDATTNEGSHDCATCSHFCKKRSNPAPLRIGYINQVWKHGEKIQGFSRFEKLFADLKKSGIEIVPVDVSHMDLGLPVYCIISRAEAASNLARFDGVRFTSAPDKPKTLADLYLTTRTSGFGDEAKTRINLGNYVTSGERFDTFYGKACAVSDALKCEFADAFNKCDALIIPTTSSDAFKIGEQVGAIESYLVDLFAVPANLVGIPSMSRPFGVGAQGLPIGLQIMAKQHGEKTIFQVEQILSEVIK